MPVARDISQIDQFGGKMKAIGYEAKGDFGITRRRFLKRQERPNPSCTYFEEGSDHIERHLVFRDYLWEYSDETARLQ